MTACIYFHPEGYTTKGRQVMGRHVAGESFLEGMLLHGSRSDLWIQVEDQKHTQVFKDIAHRCGRNEPIHAVTRAQLDLLGIPGCVFLPGPGVSEWARHRHVFGSHSWSLVGITHTTASTRAMDAISSIVTSPVQPWDALICTSQAVKNNVQRILQVELDYLSSRLGASRFPLPVLPVIPLGVHADRFARTRTSVLSARQELGLANDEIVVLFVGRLAFHGKAHPLVMYQALERSAQATGRKIVLVECGWYANQHIEKAYAKASSSASPSIRRIHLDGRDPKNLGLAFRCADLFTSLSDNIQETFGITPIEAMSAGLPVVVTDWDGYRDTVRDGIDGFRVPTRMLPPGYGNDFASRHDLGVDSYDMYCAYTSSTVVVDLDATSHAFTSLISSPELRAQMGAAARRRAVSTYDWKAIIPLYESLYAELSQIRLAARRGKTPENIRPLSTRLDPFYAFASYPTKKIKLETKVALASGSATVSIDHLEQLLGLEMVNYTCAVTGPKPLAFRIIRALGFGPMPVADIVDNLPTSEQHKQILICIAWLAKIGVLRLV